MKGKSLQQREQQLSKKLSLVKDVVELKKIYCSVQEQNNRLRQDILSLKYKVDVLMQKQKVPQHHSPGDQLKTKELEATRKELHYQYRLMQELKKRQEASKATQPTQELVEQSSRISNHIHRTEGELQVVKRQAEDLKSETARLEHTLAEHEEEITRNDPKMQKMQEENRELRKRIQEIQKARNEKEYQSAKILNSLYSIKSRYSRNEELTQSVERPLKDSQPLSALKQKGLPSKEQLVNLPELQREVEELRKAMKQRQKESIQTQLSATKTKQQLMDINKELVKQAKELDDKRSRAVNELNKYKKAWQIHLEAQNSNKHLKQYVDASTDATQYSHSLQLRRDFAGVLGGRFQFDDRLVLKDNAKSFIIGLLVYELDHTTSAKNLLVAVRAIYDDPEASAANQIPIPGHYLAKCRVSKYTMVEGDFIKLLKVKYNPQENRILKLEVRTNRNNRYEFGDKRSFADLLQGENVYGLDISVQEYPVSLFGSYNCLRSQWFLQSLGAEINELTL